MMNNLKTKDVVGMSSLGIDDALKNALEKAGDAGSVKIVETRGSQIKGLKQHYQVILAPFLEEL